MTNEETQSLRSACNFAWVGAEARRNQQNAFGVRDAATDRCADPRGALPPVPPPDRDPVSPAARQPRGSTGPCASVIAVACADVAAPLSPERTGCAAHHVVPRLDYCSNHGERADDSQNDRRVVAGKRFVLPESQRPGTLENCRPAHPVGAEALAGRFVVPAAPWAHARRLRTQHASRGTRSGRHLN